MHSLLLRVAIGLTASLLCTATARADVLPATISIGQPTVETGQAFSFTLQAPPNTAAFLIVSPGPGHVPHAGLGSIDVQLGFPSQVFFLGVTGQDGLIVRMDEVACLNGFDFFDGYMQVIGKVVQTSTFVKSNVLKATIVEGDCDQDCEGGITKLGIQTEISNVPAGPGLLEIVVKDKDEDGDIWMSFSQMVDPANPVGIPYFNTEASVEVEALSIDEEGDLVIRLEVDAVMAGLDNGELKNNTWFEISFAGQTLAHGFHTSCSQPIEVGMVFGPYTVTNLIDVGPGGGMGMGM